MPHSTTLALLAICLLVCATAGAAPDAGRVALHAIPHATWRFAGEMGARIDHNVDEWILRAPGANPGLLEMFHTRDRKLPYAELVPWAGEFAGKYLISAVQSGRMSGDKRLKPQVQSFVRQLIACQDGDGYLGPFPKARRLMGDCDLWGHYHCMLGLLMWYDDTGDRAAYQAVERAAECICRLYVDTPRRPIEAGNPNFNLAVLHVMAELYRRSGNARYLALCRRVIEDLPKDGDWLEKGLAGVPYWRLPGSGPRWEALHIVQGFATLYEATGDERYRKALLAHWDSIHRTDVHPSGAFSTNEQASGTIFASGSIETCCSVAWMAFSIDALRLTGDPKVADELELTLWNQALAAQHPSGSWCTYDTPLNGVRAPSYHQINFQYRPGAPELNCCSVNSPRTLGMLPDWAVMRRDDGLAVNFYGPCETELPVAGASVHVAQRTRYPVDGAVTLHVEPRGAAGEFTLALRIPAWSKETSVALNGKPWQEPARPGTYLPIRRRWAKGDVVELRLDMRPRWQAGGGPDRAGRIAIHAGPLLLAFDTHYNTFEESALAPIDASHLAIEQVPVTEKADGVHYPPMGLWRTRTDGGQSVTLCDFASAGANGTYYAAWLPASHVPPAPTTLLLPAAGCRGVPGPILFRWTPTAAPGETYDLVVARDASFRDIAVERRGLAAPYATVDDGLAGTGRYHWKVVTRNAWGAADSEGAPRTLVVDPAAAQPFPSVGPGNLLAASALDGTTVPSFGICSYEHGVKPAADRHGRQGGALAFAGPGSGVRYRLPYFPESDYTFAAWVCPTGLPANPLQQVFSAWCRGMDDPLRVTVEGDEVSARIEAGGGWRTPGAHMQNGRWAHVAAVKHGATLTLYVDGKPAGSVTVPEHVRSMCEEIGIGFNPLFAGGENFVGAIDDFAFFGRALTADEVAERARS